MQIMLTAAAAAALTLTGAAFAQDDVYQPEAGTYSPEPEAPVTVEDTFTKMDTDASGGVDQAEFTAFAGEGSETQFAQIAGEDGTITLDELKTYMGELTGETDTTVEE